MTVAEELLKRVMDRIHHPNTNNQSAFVDADRYLAKVVPAACYHEWIRIAHYTEQCCHCLTKRDWMPT